MRGDDGNMVLAGVKYGHGGLGRCMKIFERMGGGRTTMPTEPQQVG